MKVLIVEDEPAIRDMVAYALRKGEYDPVLAGDAREAQTAQPWSGTRLNSAQAGSRPEPVEAQPLTVAPAAQYVTRSAAQPAASPAAVASR